MSQQLFERDTLQIIGTPLSRILRKFSYGLGITIDRYVSLHSNYFRRENRDPALLVSHRNNVRKAILRPDPTFRVFYSYLSEVLQFDIVDVTVTARHRTTGLEYTVSMNDIPADEPGMLKPNNLPKEDAVAAEATATPARAEHNVIPFRRAG